MSERIVASHGLGDSAATWTPLVDRLREEAPNVEITTWDLSGHGAASPPDHTYTADVALEQLHDLVTVGATPAVLMGHSLGGYLSLRFALERPSLVAGLVLIATGPGYRNDAARAEWNSFLDRAAAKMSLAPGVEEVARQYDSSVIDGLAELAMPVLVLTGGDDSRFHAGGDHIASRAPGGRHVIIDGAGHHPHTDAPDEIARHIIRFLDSC